MKIKKILSVILSIILLMSTLLVDEISVFAAPNRVNLLADITAEDWSYRAYNKIITNTTDSRYGGTAIMNSGTVGWQNLYTKLPKLDTGATYHLSFSIKTVALSRLEFFGVAEGTTEFVWNANNQISGSDTTYKNYTKFTCPATSQDSWTDVSITINAGDIEGLDFYFNIQFGNCGTNSATISDFALYEIETDKNNLLADVKASNWLQHKWNTTITDVSDSRYGGNAILNKSVAYQNLYIPLELEVNSKYELSFSVKTKQIMRSEIFALEKDVSPAWDENNYLDATATKVYLRQSDNIAGISETAWTDVKFTFETDATVDVQYYFNLHFGAGGDTNATTISDIYLIKSDDVAPEETGLDFEDPTQWERYAFGTTDASNGPLGANDNTWHKIATNTTESEYIKEGDASLSVKSQSQINLFKLNGLKPNTNYLLKFSYITDSMKNSVGTEKNVILNSCGIWNYAAENAKFSCSNASSNGYLHVTKMEGTYFDSFFAADGSVTNDYYSRKIPTQQANTWYNKTLYFNSGDAYTTLSLVIVLEVNKAYFDSFELVAIEDGNEESPECSAPVLNGKTAKGSYDVANAITTLYENCAEADYAAYLETLTANEFSEYATNSYGDNKFATFVKGNTTVNVEYTPATSTILVSEQVTDTLPVAADENEYTDKGYQPLIIQLDHNGATGGGIGMSYIIRLADGSFILVDGGNTEKMFDNADRIYNLLKEYSTDTKPVIAAWMFTHGHEDHIGAAASFIEKYSDEVVIEEFIFNFATLEQYAAISGQTAGDLIYYGVPALLLNIKAFLPDTKISTCHSGYKYHIRNAVIDIMFTLEDIFPSVLATDFVDINDTCTTYKISFTDANVYQTLLITGDSGSKQCAAMLKKYPDTELKSTFVQAIHHGIAYGSYALYGKINPEVVLWPASSGRLMNVLYQEQNRYFVEEDSVKEVVLSDYGTRVFALPYTAPEGLTGMDKFTLPSDMDEINTVNTFVGTSIRQAGENGSETKQALRFKFQIPEHIIRANTADGYSVAEYGMMVSEDSASLTYYEGTKAYTTAEDGTRTFKGIAYNKLNGTNVVYGYENYKNLDDGESRSTQYTCALYNIGANGKTTDYTKYDTVIYVRSYIVFKNANGDTKVYYGDTKEASVFAVMTAVLKSTATDDQTVSDQTYVKNFLDGKVEGFTADADAIKAAWNADSTRASLYAPAN